MRGDVQQLQQQLDSTKPSTAKNVSQATEIENRVSWPAVVDWHLIQDSELTQLAQPEGTIFGVIGFTALGAALGATPQMLDAWGKLKLQTTAELTNGELASSIICIASSV